MLTERPDNPGDTRLHLLFHTLAPVAEVVLRCGYGRSILYSFSYETATRDFEQTVVAGTLDVERFRLRDKN